MKKTTIGGVPVFLLYYAPDWAEKIKCKFSILSETERGLTGKEDRTAMSISLRTSMDFKIHTHRQTASEFRNALKELGNSPVLCPFWPALDSYSGSNKAGISSGLWMVYESGLTLWEIYEEGSAPGSFIPSVSAKKVPLLWGRFDKAPAPEATTDELSLCDVSFIENSPAALALTVTEQSFDNGPETTALFPFLPNWAEKVSAGETAYEIRKDEVGFGRQTADAYYSQDGSRKIEQTFACTSWNAFKKMLRFFYNKTGNVEKFWAPMGASSCRLVSSENVPTGAYPQTLTDTVHNIGYSFYELFYDIPSWRAGDIVIRRYNTNVWSIEDLVTTDQYFRVISATDVPPETGWSLGYYGSAPVPVFSYMIPSYGRIIVDDGAGIGDDGYLALIQGGQAQGVTIDTVVGNTVSIEESLSKTYRPASTVISPLVLSRFESNTLECSFVTDELVIVDASFVEVPKEYTETDSGAQDPVAYLYKFSLGDTVWLFTSHEQDITSGDDTYIAKPFEHSEIKDSINFEKNDLTLKSRYFWDANNIPNRNPLGYFLPMMLEALMYIEVKECVPGTDGSVIGEISTLFSGQVGSVSFNGPYLEAKCSGKGALFDKIIPSLLIQPTCNYSVYSPACGQSLANWKMQALIVGYVAGSYEMIIATPTFVVSNPTPARPVISMFEHFFAGGKLEVGSGETLERRGMLDSVANGGNIKLTLRNPLARVPVLGAESLNLWAGCDGRQATCKQYLATGPIIDQNLEGKFGNFNNFGGFPYIPIGNPTLAKVNKDKSQGGKK
jgi:hypothetical protein